MLVSREIYRAMIPMKPSTPPGRNPISTRLDLYPGPARLAVTACYNHRWTQMNTDKDGSGPQISVTGIRSPNSDPNHGEARPEFSPRNLCSSVSICGSLLRGYGLALPLAFALGLSGLARANSAPIPFSELGTKATTDYQGEALGITVTPEGAHLRCGFQKLDGRATSQGLWLESTVPGGGQLRLVAVAVGRGDSQHAAPDGAIAWLTHGAESLAGNGTVSVEHKLARFTRPGVTEEYSVGVDGLRQDFVIESPPLNSQPSTLNHRAGDLRLELALTGARAEMAAYGAKIILESSGRALAYSRLRATDATGRELRASLEVLSAGRLAVQVEDADATYPVRIDPTFSDANWVSLNPGMPGANGSVTAMAADGSGNVYVGGDFTFIGTVVANGIAKWDGSVWSALGPGIWGGVSALAVNGTTLYAGGAFAHAGGVAANHVAKWDGSSWSALGSGMDGKVAALAVNGTTLYVGGQFSTAGGGTVNGIAAWNGSSWSALGSGISGEVSTLATSGATLYAGGRFTSAGGVAAANIAKWNGSAWSALGSGMGSNVNALALSGATLYAGGSFTTAGGAAANHIAQWNGSSWSVLGSGVDDAVMALVVSGSTLYAGGIFTNAGGVAASGVAKWDRGTWSALGSGIPLTRTGVLPCGLGGIWVGVDTLAASGTNLFVGGELFTTAGGVAADHIAQWNGNAWSALGTGMDGDVYAVAVSGTDLYAGGDFATAGGVRANRIAKWNGNFWSALGSGVGGDVYAVAVSGSDLYAGGSFTNAGGVAANCIAKWNGSSWSPLGSGMDGDVHALAVNGNVLYAGGYFTTAGGSIANGIAQWDGHTWSALGMGMDGYVYALAVSGSDLYAGGDFTTAGEETASYIAKWNGSAWSALGLGMDGGVYALAVSGTDLYAGGYFTTAGDVAASYIAKWDGSAWSALGSGMDSDVNALAVSGTDLYAAGDFTAAGGVTANYIAKWDGSTWSALGSGMDGTVSALAAAGSGHLFVGGGFSLAGANVSPFIAQANIIGGVSEGRFGGLVYSPTSGFACTFSDATIGQPYRIQRSSSLAGGSWTDFTNITYKGPIVLTDPSAATGPKRFYRAVTP